MHTSTLALLLLMPWGTLAQRQRTSNDATCGGNKAYTCLGSAWGNCCSKNGWCGTTNDYCGDGCNSKFGVCTSEIDSHSVSSAVMIISSSTRTSSVVPAASSQTVSQDSRCGPSFGGKTCQGSKWGNCCSQYSYCGSTNDYCDANTCQKGFGKCNTVSSSSSRVPSTLATSRSLLSTVKSSSSTSTSKSSVASSSSSDSSKSSSLTPVSVSVSQASTMTPISASSAVVTSSSSAISSAPPNSSSSSTISSTTPSSSSSSTLSSTPLSPTPTPAACPYIQVSDCTPFIGTFASSCPANSLKCSSGFQVRCSSMPSSAGVLSFKLTSEIPTADACVAWCGAEVKCAAATFSSRESACILWSNIDPGYKDLPSPDNLFMKLCTNSPTSSMPVVSSSPIPSSV